MHNMDTKEFHEPNYLERILEIGNRLKEERKYNPIKHKKITLIPANRKTSFEPYSVDWTTTLKISIRQRDRYTCQICGKQQGDNAFSVHHIDYNKQNCNPENLITLCNSCHSKTNYNRKEWIEYFNCVIPK
jgi:5-methylcytosine-specific restriction endonuclease McrA